MTYRYYYTKPYADCVESFRTRDERALLDLHLALNELAGKPFGNPRLESHAMERAQGKTYISYVGNRGHRLIWRLANQTIILLLFGEHDPVEKRAERLRLDIDLEEDRVRVLDVDPATEKPQTYEERRQLEGFLFMAWTDAELAGFGFAPQEIAVLRRLDDEAQLVDLEPRMRPDAFRVAYNLIAFGNAEGTVHQAAPVAAEPAQEFVLQREDEAEADRVLERTLIKPQSRAEFAPVPAEALAAVLDKPIEDWMIFLHPDQVKLVERPFSGPARIRGAAGTGKTVVALHRAKHLADTYQQRVLFTTYVTNLPPVFEELYRRLSPNTSDSVEFINLHKWAWRFLAQNGERPKTDVGGIDAAFTDAWHRVGRADTPLASGYGRGYYKEEIDWVIKGRGLSSLDAYLALARTGRGTGLPAPHRRAVWELYAEYQEQLRKRGVHDFNDVLLRALEIASDPGFVSPYAAVVIDEAQDLTEVGVRLVYALAGGDKRDGLFLVGDGQQSVYPGGYSLGSLGINVAGRSAVLRTNYRNTAQILEAARRVVGDRPFDDLEDEVPQGRRDVDVVRKGEPPLFCGFADADDHDTALVAAIDDAACRPGVSAGDLAVLVPTNKLVAHYTKIITDLGYKTVKLERYDGKPSDQVKVGTYQRGKGLEFKWVFLPRLDADALGEKQHFNEDADAHAERIDLLRRRLFVAMTRARDQLWGGWVGEPSAVLKIGAEV